MHLSCILVIGCKKRDGSKLPKLLIIVQPWVSELDRYPSCKSESKLDSNFLLGLQNARQPKRPNSRSNKQQQSVDCSDKKKIRQNCHYFLSLCSRSEGGSQQIPMNMYCKEPSCKRESKAMVTKAAEEAKLQIKQTTTIC